MTSPKITIHLDNPSLSYFPGQLVSGKIVVKTRSEKTAQGLLLKLKGTTSVHWTEEKTESSGFKKCKLVREVSKSFDDTDIFFEFKNYILGDGQNDVKICVGESVFPFYIQLPTKNMPSSYLGPYGKVEYVLEANLKRPKWKSVLLAKKHITVNAAVDLNNIWEAVEPGLWRATKRFGLMLLPTGRIKMDVRLKCTAFCPGEFIPIEVDIRNKSERKINELSAELMQETTFHARNKITDTNKLKTFITINSCKMENGVSSGDSSVWQTELQIPSIPPTQLGGGCKLIEVQYFLVVTAHFTDTMLNFKQKCPLKIGTIPLRSKFAELGSSMQNNGQPMPYHSMPSGHSVIPPILFRNSFNFKRGSESEPPVVSESPQDSKNVNKISSQEPEFIPNYVTYQGKSNYCPQRPLRSKKESECGNDDRLSGK